MQGGPMIMKAPPGIKEVEEIVKRPILDLQLVARNARTLMSDISESEVLTKELGERVEDIKKRIELLPPDKRSRLDKLKLPEILKKLSETPLGDLKKEEMEAYSELKKECSDLIGKLDELAEELGKEWTKGIVDTVEGMYGMDSIEAKLAKSFFKARTVEEKAMIAEEGLPDEIKIVLSERDGYKKTVKKLEDDYEEYFGALGAHKKAYEEWLTGRDTGNKEMREKAEKTMEKLEEDIILPYEEARNKKRFYWISAFFTWTGACMEISRCEKMPDDMKKETIKQIAAVWIGEMDQTVTWLVKKEDVWTKPIGMALPKERGMLPENIMSAMEKLDKNSHYNGLKTRLSGAIGSAVELYRAWKWMEGLLDDIDKGKKELTPGENKIILSIVGVEVKGLDPTKAVVIDRFIRKKLLDIEKEVRDSYYRSVYELEEIKGRLDLFHGEASAMWDIHIRLDAISKLKGKEAEEKLKELAGKLEREGYFSKEDAKDARNACITGTVSKFAGEMSKRMLENISSFYPAMPIRERRVRIETRLGSYETSTGVRTDVYTGASINWLMRYWNCSLFYGIGGSLSDAGKAATFNFSDVKLSSHLFEFGVHPPIPYRLPKLLRERKIGEAVGFMVGNTKELRYTARVRGDEYRKDVVTHVARKFGLKESELEEGFKAVFEPRTDLERLTTKNVEFGRTVLSTPVTIYETRPRPGKPGKSVGALLEYGTDWGGTSERKIGGFYGLKYGGGQGLRLYGTHEYNEFFDKTGWNVGANFDAWPIGEDQITGSFNVFGGKRKGEKVTEISVQVSITPTALKKLFGR